MKIKPRTSLKISHDGIIYCTCGTLYDFCNDIEHYIVPLIDTSMTVRFNDRFISVNTYDTVDTIMKKFTTKITLAKQIEKEINYGKI